METNSNAELALLIAKAVAEQLEARPKPPSRVAELTRRFAPSGLAGLATVAALLLPDLQAMVAGNPLLTVILASLGAIATHLAPSPLRK